MNRINSKLIQSTLAALLVTVGLTSTAVLAADEAKDFSGRIGVVNSERIFKESNMAKASQAKLQSEFAKREKELRDDAQKIKTAAEKLDKDAAVMPDAERVRKQREFTEDVNQRSFEERSKIAQKANQALKVVAEQRKLDLIVQEAAYVSPKIELTDDVIKALNNLR